MQVQMAEVNAAASTEPGLSWRMGLAQAYNVNGPQI